MPSDLSRAMNDAVLRRLAGDSSYQRGKDYYSHGHVESLEDRDGAIHAVVRGTQNYTVELSSDDGVLDYSCDCPQGGDGAFCKHCVAVGLAWLNHTADARKPNRPYKPKEITLAAARRSLLAEERETIVETLFEWAKTDARLRERLILFAARRAGAETGVAAVRKAFEKAVRVRGFLHYREMASYARGVNVAIDSIEQLLQDGQAAAVIELCESALSSLMGAMGSADDSDGHMSILRDRFEDLHHNACEEARPEPVALAERLFQWELHGDFDTFFDAVSTYAGVLGSKGLEAYRKLAEAQWESVPAWTSDRAPDSERPFRITHIVESLARLANDVEQLVAVISRDLSHAYSYLRIAEVYRQAGQAEKALLWAEKGMNAFPERTDDRLRKFVAEEYHGRGRHGEAMKLMWAAFFERPGLEAYRTLQRHAEEAGNWPEWRELALVEFRGRIQAAREKNRGQAQPRWMRCDESHSSLVEIFLYEQDVEAAWREAQAGGCSDSLWLQLAAARQHEYPEDAAPIYIKQAEAAIVMTHNSRYDKSVDLLVKAAAVMKRLNRSEEFVHHIESLRVKYKAKRNFIKLLERHQKALYAI